MKEGFRGFLKYKGKSKKDKTETKTYMDVVEEKNKIIIKIG